MIQVLSGSGELPFIVNFYTPGTAEHKWYHLILIIIIYGRYYSHFTEDETQSVGTLMMVTRLEVGKAGI